MPCFRMAPVPQFGLAEKAYSAFRPAYPTALFGLILERVPPDRRKRAVDLGAGTGLSSQELCRHFDEVIAVEPDEAMARWLYQLVPNLAVRQMRAEDCSFEAASVDLVTCGNAFYWMDGPRVLARIAGWLTAEGLLAVNRGSFPRCPPPVQAVLEREMVAHWDAFRHDRLRDEEYSIRTIRAAPQFAIVAVESVPNTVSMTATQLAGFCASTSYGSATCARSTNRTATSKGWKSL